MVTTTTQRRSRATMATRPSRRGVATRGPRPGTITFESLRHLRQAARLGGTAAELTTRLYGAGAAFGTTTALASIATLSVNPDAVIAVVAAHSHWQSPADASAGWTYFVRPGAKSLGGSVTHKLYVSPVVTERATMLGAIAHALDTAGIGQFKVGRGRDGWLRPDWLVAYSDSFGHLRIAARKVAAACAETHWHGVPFSTEVGHGPGVSVGIDPPVRSDDPMSWRLFVCATLAGALLATDGVAPPRRERDLDASIVRALTTAKQAGIDTTSWRPTQDLIDAWAAADQPRSDADADEITGTGTTSTRTSSTNANTNTPTGDHQ